ncbi:MAG: PKD domain-containing protein [Bacteroidota bacterium]
MNKQIDNHSNFLLLWTGILCLLVGGACQERELPEEIKGNPVFYVDGAIDGQDLTLTAGEDGYFMETSFEQDETGVYVYSGAFTPLNCESCPEALEVRIRDHRLRPDNDPVRIDSVLHIGSYEFYQTNNKQGAAIFRVSFSNESTGTGPHQYSWDFGDGSTASGPNPSHDYIDTTMATALVCLDGVDPTGCTTQICNEIQLHTLPCQADFTHELDPSITYVSFMNAVEGALPIQYRWDFGDGYGASLGNPGYFYQEAGLYQVCLEITDANGCQSAICKNIAADPELCEHNFSYKVEQTNLSDSLQFSQVEIRWTDESGTSFTTASQEQSSLHYFDILEIEPYENNRFGDQTRRLRVRLDCEVHSDSGIKHVQKVEGFLAIAFPE